MFTHITGYTGALITAIVMLTGGEILRGGAAAADSNQDQQFLALLDKEDIPVLDNAPALIATAHRICGKLDGGMAADDLVNVMKNNAYKSDPVERLFPPARLTSTMTRFITAAVEAYCPYDQGKIASIMANPLPGSNGPTHRGGGVFVAGHHGGDRSDDARGTVLVSLIGAVPSGEIPKPNPPQIPGPPPPTAQIPAAAPPTAQILTPPRPVVAPPPPKQSPPAPKQAQPPAVAPQPGGGVGGGGSGSSGGAGPAQPSPPPPPRAPGRVRLAP